MKVYNRKKDTLVFGVGINDADYVTSTVRKDGYEFACPFYKTWLGMITRGYSAQYKEKYPTYQDCFVNEDWHLFSNFKSWMEAQVWIDKSGNKLALDKDILIKENKVYGPETCAFVPKRINGLLLYSEDRKGELPFGVMIHKDRHHKQFRGQINNFGKRDKSPYFYTPEDAHKWWQEMKVEVIKESINWWRNDEIVSNSFRQDVADALLKRADVIEYQRLNNVQTVEF